MSKTTKKPYSKPTITIIREETAKKMLEDAGKGLEDLKKNTPCF